MWEQTKKLSVLHWIGIVFGVLIIINLFNSPDSSNFNSPDSSDNNGFSTTPAAKKPTSTFESPLPSDQEKFIEIVSSSAKKFTGAKNELQESVLRDERKTLLSNFQIGDSVSGWIGTINTLQTNTEGKAILSIRISPDIKIETWNNALSDINSYTLIEKGSDLYNQLLELSVGQRVKFSGSFFPSRKDFFRETSITIDGSMKNPEFLFKFISVEVVN